MKKIILLISTIIVTILCLTGCTSNINTIKEIEFSQLQEKIENKETFILEVIQTGCSHCEELSPRLKIILADNHLTAYSINLYNLTDEERKQLYDITYISGTPTIVFFTNGIEESDHKIVGAVSNNVIENHLKSLHYIK